MIWVWTPLQLNFSVLYLEKTVIKEKEARVGRFFKEKNTGYATSLCSLAALISEPKPGQVLFCSNVAYLHFANVAISLYQFIGNRQRRTSKCFLIKFAKAGRGVEPGIFRFSFIFSLNSSTLDHSATAPPPKKFEAFCTCLSAWKKVSLVSLLRHKSTDGADSEQKEVETNFLLHSNFFQRYFFLLKAFLDLKLRVPFRLRSNFNKIKGVKNFNWVEELA